MATHTLPQNDGNGNRASELETVRKDYGYDFTYQVPVGTTHYSRDRSGAEWAAKVLKGLIDARSNLEACFKKTGWKMTKPMATLSPKDLAGYLQNLSFPNLFDYYLGELGQVEGQNRPASLDDYKAVFQKVQLTYMSERFMEDEYFAHSYLAGPHANAFEQMTQIPANFPVSNDIFRKTKEFAGDDLQRAINAGRVFICDYKAMNAMVSGVHPLQKKYIFQPIVAFATPENGGKTMVPFAIQCGQVSAEFPIFTPADEWAWQMAKGTAWVAHYCYHELITHLGVTHLLTEAMVIATRRQLHESHPVYGLLSPHFEGTMLINRLAMTDLIQDGQAVDRLVGSDQASNYGLIAKERLGYSFSKNYLPVRLKSRGLTSAKTLPIYHYRDDGIPIWNAVRAWVGKYIDRYYADDATVRADLELQAWAAEISSNEGGRVKDFAANGGVENKDQLIDVCTMIIYTAGPQHAAVNFPQLTDMSFLPGGPLAGYRKPPENAKMTKNDFLDFLPPLDVAIKQWQTMHFLGSVRYTTLGKYKDGSFDDAAIKAANATFLADLARIEEQIKGRNEKRIPYTHLLPSLIPQSTNI